MNELNVFSVNPVPMPGLPCVFDARSYQRLNGITTPPTLVVVLSLRDFCEDCSNVTPRLCAVPIFLSTYKRFSTTHEKFSSRAYDAVFALAVRCAVTFGPVHAPFLKLRICAP